MFLSKGNNSVVLFQINPHQAAGPFFKQLPESLVLEATNHWLKV